MQGHWDQIFICESGTYICKQVKQLNKDVTRWAKGWKKPKTSVLNLCGRKSPDNQV
jgi:hypothetical protein